MEITIFKYINNELNRLSLCSKCEIIHEIDEINFYNNLLLQNGFFNVSEIHTIKTYHIYINKTPIFSTNNLLNIKKIIETVAAKYVSY